jgi:predicted ribosome quality control (RQC) complex YloA/Tae2 family protein
MAAVNALRLAYTRMGFSAAMAAYITQEQGINTLDELRNLEDKAVERLCQALKKPGGTIPNPNAGAQGALAQIPNPGYNVSIKAEENLKLAAYFVRHQQRISRPVSALMITIDSVRGLKELKAAEETHKDPTKKPVINEKNWPRTLDNIEEYLRNHLGQTDIPLSYIVRKEADVVPSLLDPQANYSIIHDEMIAWAAHMDANGDRTQLYNTDNKRVWALIHELTRNHKCYTYIKSFARARDGRAAYLALRDHYLGMNNVNRLASGAENMLHTARYQNESKRFNFES